ncbi:hypothetical protein R1sor_006141 [Riccia sorocarpa]|uniref:Uncharacterized protein n=1 Tax=Riccia sorocarpa TaxID=122646 RepID=A0ABD3HLJ1_9MARC
MRSSSAAAVQPSDTLLTNDGRRRERAQPCGCGVAKFVVMLGCALSLPLPPPVIHRYVSEESLGDNNRNLYRPSRTTPKSHGAL